MYVIKIKQLSCRTVMSDFSVPPGWIRKKVGRKIVFISDAPRVHIWNIKEFDKFQGKGRFSTVNRDALNFSVKVSILLIVKTFNKIFKTIF